MTRSASGACRSVGEPKHMARACHTSFTEATKKPESADRVRAPCTARYDAVRLRRLQARR
jgi:hypothetical protein